MSFIIHVQRVQEKEKYEFAQIIAINETPGWSDMVSAKTINATGKKKTTTMNSTDHEIYAVWSA